MITTYDLDDMLAKLRKQLARGGLTYKRAVDLDCLIYAFERLRTAQIAEDREIDRLARLRRAAARR